MKSKKVNDILNRIHVAMPQPRDSKDRAPCIPAAVRQNKMIEATINKMKTERDIEVDQGDDYILDLKKKYDLPEDQKYDVIPEIWYNHNVADYIDPSAKEKLAILEKEEALREAAGYYDEPMSDEDEELTEKRRIAQIIRRKQKIMQVESRVKKASTKPKMPRTGRTRERSASRLRSEMGELGVGMGKDKDAHYMRKRSASRSASRPVKRTREDSEGRVRSSSKRPRDQSGVRDVKMEMKVKKIAKKAQNPANRNARKGEGDRVILDMKPKHLFSGKRKMGKTDRR